MRRLPLLLLALLVTAVPAQAADAPAAPAPATTTSPLAAVVAAVTAAAEEVNALPLKDRPTGDALGDLYVRRAAAAAGEDARAFLLGLAHAAEGSGAIARLPGAKARLAGVETEEAAARRRAALGAPSCRGRADLFAHFVVSGGLVAVAGESVASALGLGKELADAKGPSGFSFSDLLADDAGIAFARWLLDPEGKGRLAAVATSFAGPAFLPDPAGLPDGIPQARFEREYRRHDGRPVPRGPQGRCRPREGLRRDLEVTSRARRASRARQAVHLARRGERVAVLRGQQGPLDRPPDPDRRVVPGDADLARGIVGRRALVLDVGVSRRSRRSRARSPEGPRSACASSADRVDADPPQERRGVAADVHGDVEDARPRRPARASPAGAASWA